MVKRDASSWRKKAMLDIKTEDIRQITVKKPGVADLVLSSSTVAEASEGAPRKVEWSLASPTPPAGFRIDKALLSRVATSVATLRAVDFADEATDAAAALGSTGTVIVATSTGEKTIRFGATDAQQRSYAQIEGDKQIYVVAPFNAKSVLKEIADFRDLSLGVSPESVVEATFTSGASILRVVKEGDVWKVATPKAVPATIDVAQIGAGVAAAARMRATKVLDKGASAIGGRGPMVTFVDKDKKKSTIVFGGKIVDAEGKETGEVYAVGVDGSVYAVGASLKARYEKPFELMKTPPPPQNGGMPGMPGMPQGMENLPPDVRKKLEEAMKKQPH
jgi:hypothetical protein